MSAGTARGESDTDLNQSPVASYVSFVTGVFRASERGVSCGESTFGKDSHRLTGGLRIIREAADNTQESRIRTFGLRRSTRSQQNILHCREGSVGGGILAGAVRPRIQDAPGPIFHLRPDEFDQPVIESFGTSGGSSDIP